MFKKTTPHSAETRRQKWEHGEHKISFVLVLSAFSVQGAGDYDWEAIETQMEPKFREAAVDFRDQKHSFVCPRKDELDEDLQEKQMES